MNRAYPPRDGDERSWSALPVARKLSVIPGESAPESAETYLLAVRQEACTIPDVLFSNSALPAPEPVRVKPSEPRMLTGWAASALEAFSALHAYVASCEAFREAGGVLPAAPKLPHWRVLVFAEQPPSQPARGKRRRVAADVEDWPSSGDEGLDDEDAMGCGVSVDTSCDSSESGPGNAAPSLDGTSSAAPWLSTVLALDQRGVRDVLDCVVSECEARGYIGLLTAVWLYALLSRLQRPLLSSDASAVRRLFVLCTSLLAGASTASASGGPGRFTEEAGLRAALDALVLITGTFFGQRLSHE